MEDRSRYYRDIAAALRAKAASGSDEQARLDMVNTAEVWNGWLPSQKYQHRRQDRQTRGTSTRDRIIAPTTFGFL